MTTSKRNEIISLLESFVDLIAERVAEKLVERKEAKQLPANSSACNGFSAGRFSSTHPESSGTYSGTENRENVEITKGDLLTKQQAAKKLQVTIRTIDRYRKERELKWVELAPGMIRFRPQDIEEFVAKCVARIE